MLVSEIAEREQAPRKFLELILLDLKRHGLVYSQRGKNGGYALGEAGVADHGGRGHPHPRWAARAVAVRQPHRLSPMFRLCDEEVLSGSPRHAAGP